MASEAVLTWDILASTHEVTLQANCFQLFSAKLNNLP